MVAEQVALGREGEARLCAELQFVIMTHFSLIIVLIKRSPPDLALNSRTLELLEID